MKMTPWFSPDISPVRVGMYECSTCQPPFKFHYWNGKKWLVSRNDVQGIGTGCVTWRGLSEKPK